MPTPITDIPQSFEQRPGEADAMYAAIYTYSTGGTGGAVMGPIELLRACQALVAAYQAAAEDGGSVDWSDLDDAAMLAARALGVTL